MAINCHSGVGAGKLRDPWEIRKHLSTLGKKMADVARETGIGYTTVADTINGRRNNRQVLRYLYFALKCPAEPLSLPADIKKEAANAG